MAVSDYFTTDKRGLLREISPFFSSCASVIVHEMEHNRRAAGFYWGCEQPERPHSLWTCYMDTCDACFMAATAALVNGHDVQHPGVSYQDDDARVLFQRPQRVTTFGDWWIDALRQRGEG